NAMAELGRLLMYEASRDWLPTVSGEIQSPLGVAEVEFIDPREPVAVIPILRAGLALAEHASSILPATKTYHLGVSRNEETLEPTVYLNKLPDKFSEGTRVFIVDPMLATGGTIVAAIDLVKERGVDNQHIKVVSAVACPPALQKLSEKYPGLHVYAGIIDPTLTDKGMIIPGLGDAGDRSFAGVGPLSGKGSRVIVSADASILPRSVFVRGSATGAALKILTCVFEISGAWPFITSLKCVLTQEHLDAICAKYFVPEEVHPQLPSSDATMHERPTGKIGMYTRFFDYANYRIPFSTFFVSVLTHFRIPFSQLSVFGSAKVSHFEILCRVCNIEPDVSLFRYFYTHNYKNGWFGFTKRPNVRACYSKNLDSVKNWNDHFFWVDEFVVPANARFSWFSGSNIVKDRAPAPSEYNVEHVNTLIAQASPFLRFPEEFLCWVGISRNYLLNKDTYPRFEYENGEEMDLNAFIRTADPRKVRIVESDRPSGELSESIEREFGEDGSGGGGQEDASVAGHGNVRSVVPITDDIVVEADVSRPKRSKKKRVIYRSEGTPASSHPPKRLRVDYGRIGGSTAGGKSPGVLNNLLQDSRLSVEQGVTALPTLPFITSPLEEARFVVLYDSSHHSATNSVGPEGNSFVRSIVPVMTEATTVTTIATTVAIPADVGKDKSKTVTKGFELNDGRSCANMIDHFTPPAFFKTVGRIEHEQLFAEFNVRRTQFKFDAPEVENACGRTFIFEGKGNGNKEESVVVPNSVIGFQLEAIEKGSPLRGNDRELSWLGNISSSSYGSQNHGLVSQVHELETSSARLREQLDLYEGNMKRRVDADSQVLYALRKEFPSATSSTSLAKQSEYLVSLDHPLSVEALIEPPVVVPATNALSSEGSLSVPIMVLLFPVDDYEKKSS
ncbi:uracil phosphoribosyltransferase, partial [Tanacetum coccineum]